MNYFNV